MKLVGFGANGRVGQRVVDEALARGHEVSAPVRDPKTFSENMRVRVTRADATDSSDVADAALGQHAAVSAIGPASDGDPQVLVEAARALLTGLSKSGVRRLIVTGGAGSLEVAPGQRLLDSPQFPAPLRQLALAHAEAPEVYTTEGEDLDWTYLSPPSMVAPGQRTGQYSTGKDTVIADAGGDSHPSIEDLVVAIVDELESPCFIKQRYTVGPSVATAAVSGPPSPRRPDPAR